MKKQILVVISVLLIFFLVIWLVYSSQLHQNSGRSGTETSTNIEQKKPSVTLVINDGQNVATYSGVTASNAFEALSVITTKQHIDIETKKYDFGIFVAKLAGKESGKDMAWIYFINGVSGKVAADRVKLKAGDMIEWKYIKSIY